MIWPWRKRRPDSEAASGPTGRIDRLVIQQSDIRRTVTIGGIDTCLRGFFDYAPEGVELGHGRASQRGRGSTDRPLGVWERHHRGDREIWFLPVARIDTGRPKGLVPYSLRLVAGLLRYRRAIPRPKTVQAHRVDVGLFTRLLFRGAAGVLHPHPGAGPARAARRTRSGGSPGALHERLDRMIVQRAARVIVFNPATRRRCGGGTRTRSPRPPGSIRPSPGRAGRRRPARGGLGRAAGDPEGPRRWRFGRSPTCADRHPTSRGRSRWWGPARCDPRSRSRSPPCPRTSPPASRCGGGSARRVAEARSRSGVFLMTSHAGYEGFPRVLVEAMATGLPAVVTEGSDTGGLVREGVSGFVRGRDPAALADAIRVAQRLDRAEVADAVADLSAPRVVRDVFFARR